MFKLVRDASSETLSEINTFFRLQDGIHKLITAARNYLGASDAF
jgi:hypothetical protein